MKSFIQIVGAGTGDMPPSCMYFYDQARFLINCGEGSQRFFTQHKLKLSKISTIFLTQLGWDHIGGLPGMILTAADAGAPFVRIFGPRNTKHAISSLRGFVQRTQFPVSVHEIHDYDTLSLDSINVQAIELLPDNSPSVTTSNYRYKELERMFKGFDPINPPSFPDRHGRPASPTPESHDPDSRMVTIASSSFPSNSIKHEDNYHPVGADFDTRMLPSTSPICASLCYIIKGPDLPGRFFPHKAQQLGVKPGPLYSKLVRGESIQLESNGTWIHPKDCMGPSRTGDVSIYMDIPSIDYLSSLFTKHSNVFSPYQGDGSIHVDCILHQIGHDVLSHSEYKNWMTRFGPNTKHIIFDPFNSDQRICFTSAALLQYHLHSFFPIIFPTPWHIYDSSSLKNYQSANIIAAEPLLFYHFNQNRNESKDENNYLGHFDRSSCLPTNLDLKQPILIEDRDVRRIKLDAIKDPVSDTEIKKPSELKVCFLGTGSALPSKYRNVSCIYLEIKSFGGILLDCGEGSYGQMIRCFGLKDTRKILMDLKVIFISHLHADHHLGLIKILQERKSLLNGANIPITLIAPPRFRMFLQEYHQVCPIELDSINFVNSISRNELDPIWTSGGLSIRTIPVIHTPSSYGIILERKDYFKLV